MKEREAGHAVKTHNNYMDKEPELFVIVARVFLQEAFFVNIRLVKSRKSAVDFNSKPTFYYMKSFSCKCDLKNRFHPDITVDIQHWSCSY